MTARRSAEPLPHILVMRVRAGRYRCAVCLQRQLVCVCREQVCGRQQLKQMKSMLESECVHDRQLSLDTHKTTVWQHRSSGNIFNYRFPCTSTLMCVNLHADAFVLYACQVLDKEPTYNFIWFQCLSDIDAFPRCVLPFPGFSFVCVRGQGWC